MSVWLFVCCCRIVRVDLRFPAGVDLSDDARDFIRLLLVKVNNRRMPACQEFRLLSLHLVAQKLPQRYLYTQIFCAACPLP